MASYQPTRTQSRRLIRHLLWLNQGGKCKICNFPKEEDEGITEHANGDTTDYAPENIGFVCFSCNQRKRPDFVTKGMLSTGIGEREITNGGSGASAGVVETETEQQRKRQRLQRAPAEIQINKECEPLFWKYLWENVGRRGELLKEDAIAEGAAVSGANVQTIEKYLKPLTSLYGPFRIVPSGESEVIKLRDSYDPARAAHGKVHAELMRQRRERELAEKEAEILAKEKEVMDKADAEAAIAFHKRQADEAKRKLADLEEQLKRQMPQIEAAKKKD